MDTSEVSEGLVPRWSVNLGNVRIAWDGTRVEQTWYFCLSPAAKVLSWPEDMGFMVT